MTAEAVHNRRISDPFQVYVLMGQIATRCRILSLECCNSLAISRLARKEDSEIARAGTGHAGGWAMCWLSAQRADEVASGTTVWPLDSLAAGSTELPAELLRRLIAETSAI